MPEFDDSFTALLGRQPTDAERLQLFKIRDALGIGANDALWQVLIALQFYQTQYERFPEQIQKACAEVLVEARATATATAKAAAEHARAEIARAVGRGGSRKQLVQWCISGIVIGAALVALGAWWGYRSGFPAGQVRGGLPGVSATAEEVRLAADLIRSGSLRVLSRCEGPGWQVRSGKCYPLPTNGTVYGWAVASKSSGKTQEK